jgi:hypothetical protein
LYPCPAQDEVSAENELIKALKKSLAEEQEKSDRVSPRS